MPSLRQPGRRNQAANRQMTETPSTGLQQGLMRSHDGGVHRQRGYFALFMPCLMSKIALAIFAFIVFLSPASAASIAMSMARIASFLSPPLLDLAFTTALLADRNETKGSLAFLAASRWATALAKGPGFVGSFATTEVANRMLDRNKHRRRAGAGFMAEALRGGRRRSWADFDDQEWSTIACQWQPEGQRWGVLAAVADITDAIRVARLHWFLFRLISTSGFIDAQLPFQTSDAGRVQHCYPESELDAIHCREET